jgi:sugar phosphate permease
MLRRLHYAWVVAGATFVVLVMAAGFRSTAGILLVPLHESFGWSHQAISVAVGINLLCYGLGAPFATALVERFGMRRLMICALVTIAVSSVVTIWMTATWQLYVLWGVVNGTATGAIAIPLAATVSTRWFVERRGLVTGLLSASNASGQLVFLPVLAWLAGYDWRYVAVAVAAVALCVVVPIVFVFVRDHPSDIGVRQYGAQHDYVRPALQGNPFSYAIRVFREAARSGVFWLLVGSFFICGATTNGLIQTHLIPAAHDHGITQVKAAGLLALIGVFDIIGSTCSGWLTDRFDARYLLFWYYGLRGLSLLALPFLFTSAEAGLVVFAVFYGLDWVATVPPTVALTSKWFGRERTAILFAWIFGAHQLGAAFAAEGAGAIRTIAGQYDMAFYSAGALGVVAAALAVVIRRESRPPAPAPA